jgi:hypothetical protein
LPHEADERIITTIETIGDIVIRTAANAKERLPWSSRTGSPPPETA